MRGGAGRRTGSSKRVARCKFPHAGEELGETPTKEGHADDGVADGDVAGLGIVEGENEGGGREGEKAAVMRGAG